MYWRILAAIILLVGSSYVIGNRSRHHAETPATSATAPTSVRPVPAASQTASEEPEEVIASAPSVTPGNGPITAPPVVTDRLAPAAAASSAPEPERSYSLDIVQEVQRIASAAGLSIAAISATDKLPPGSPMAMTFRSRGCVLLVNTNLPLNGLVLNNLTLYGQRQLTFTLAHETGHCYMLTRVVQRDASFLPSLSPPGKSYNFEQYAAMSAKYSEYPDLNRWNEEWADTFAAFVLNRAYGKDFAVSVTSERYALRKNQEKNGDVLMSNVYGGHGSLTEEAIFTIQSPLEIANLVKLGRLNTSR